MKKIQLDNSDREEFESLIRDLVFTYPIETTSIEIKAALYDTIITSFTSLVKVDRTKTVSDLKPLTPRKSLPPFKISHHGRGK
jgi:hypothetical protein